MAAIHLNHTIVPAHDRTRAAGFFAEMFELAVGAETGPFTPVRVDDRLTFDFAEAPTFETHHYGFLVGDDDFDRILDRLRRAGVPYGAGPGAGWNQAINHLNGGRGVYFQDPNGHSYEIFTRI
jgi:catechol 2,3-dioxygenase-like lactoylglutathione lyase family enzyme